MMWFPQCFLKTCLLVFLPLSSFRFTITARVVLWRRNSHGPFRISTFSEFQNRSFLWLRPSSRIRVLTISTYTAMFCQFNSTWLSMPWAWQWDYDQDRGNSHSKPLHVEESRRSYLMKWHGSLNSRWGGRALRIHWRDF